MGAPLAVCLKNKKTGEEQIFGSMAQACDWLNRSKTYLKYKIMFDDGFSVTNRNNEEFDLTITGIGKRRDAVEKEIRPKDQRFNAHQYPPQLCVRCARATGFCPWSQRLEPVNGWEAETVRILFDGSVNYLIKRCPLFMEDAKTIEGRREQRKLLYRELEDEIEKEKSGKAGTSAPASAGQGTELRDAAKAMAEAAARTFNPEGHGE